MFDTTTFEGQRDNIIALVRAGFGVSRVPETAASAAAGCPLVATSPRPETLPEPPIATWGRG